MRALRSDLKIPVSEWTKTVRYIQFIVNNSPSRSLGNRAPTIAHTGMDSGSPLNLALKLISQSDASSIDEARVMQNLKVEELQDSLDSMRKEVFETLSAERKKELERHDSKTHGYVVVARQHSPRTKVSYNSVGPRRVVEALSEFTFRVEYMITN